MPASVAGEQACPGADGGARHPKRGGASELVHAADGRVHHGNGRRTIGWDEILEGGLAGNSAVMSGAANRAESRRQLGHDVVMAPSDLTYFNYYQDLPVEEEPLAIGGFVPVSMVYAWEPVLGAGRRSPVRGRAVPALDRVHHDQEQPSTWRFPCRGIRSAVDRAGAEELRLVSSNGFEHRKRLAVLGVKAHPRRKASGSRHWAGCAVYRLHR